MDPSFQKRTFSFYFYRLFLRQQLKESTKLKSNETFMIGNQIIYKVEINMVSVYLTVFSQNRCQPECYVRKRIDEFKS